MLIGLLKFEHTLLGIIYGRIRHTMANISCHVIKILLIGRTRGEHEKGKQRNFHNTMIGIKDDMPLKIYH